MTANDLRRIAKMSEWKERVAECRSSGMGVKEWCAAQGISNQTYYRWEKLIIAEASGKLQAQNSLGTISTPATTVPVFAELDPLKTATLARNAGGAVATIQCGNISIDLYANADPSFIVSLCKELQHAQ